MVMSAAMLPRMSWDRVRLTRRGEGGYASLILASQEAVLTNPGSAALEAHLPLRFLPMPPKSELRHYEGTGEGGLIGFGG